jgi:Domain of unknown function (DUF4214)
MRLSRILAARMRTGSRALKRLLVMSLSVVVLVSGQAFGSASHAVAAPPATALLTGTVTDSVTQAPLANVTITDAVGSKTAQTDAAGTYSLAVSSPPTKHPLTAQLPGYEWSDRTTIVPLPNSTTTQDFSLVQAATPTILGIPTVGQTLTASVAAGSWGPVPATTTWQWYADGVAIGAATTTSLTLAATEAGKVITVAATKTLSGYVPIRTVSAATAAVVLPSVTAGSVSIVGAVEVGATLTAVTSGWLPAGVVFSYQWLVDGAPIGGASAGTYVPVAGDVGHALSVTVTGSADGYLPVDLTSAETAAVIVPVVPSVTAGTPTITGTAAVSGTLVAQPGSWTPAGVVFSYQWSTDAGPISGATSSSYVPTTADVGHRLTVAVTGSKDGYAPATVASAATAAVQSSTSVLAYEAFVKASYVDFLGRVPSAGEVAFQATALSEGRVTKAQYLASLSTSNEWLTAIVTKMYRDTLNRDPDPNGLAGWVSWLRSGRFTVAEAASRFYSSNEYYTVTAGGSTSTWVTLLYQKLLIRTPDPRGLQFWIDNTGKYGRDWVTYNFYQSAETRIRRVEAMYLALLYRGPDAIGWPFWTARVLSTGDLTLAWEIANSDEYWEKAHVRL